MRAELVTARALAILPAAMVRAFVARIPDVDRETQRLDWAIAQALREFEQRTDGHLLGSQTWRIWYDAAEIIDPLRLPVGPLTSVTSITSYDADDVAAVLSATNYQAVAGQYGYVTLAADGSWPSSLRTRDAMAVVVVVGETGTKSPYIAPIGTPTLDDAMVSGAYVGTGRALYEIDVQTAATPDTFRWRRITHDSVGNKTYGAWTSGVAMTGAAQALGTDGISVTFLATTGHAATDEWTIEVREVVPDDILSALIGLAEFFYRTGGTLLAETAGGGVVGLSYGVQALCDRYRREPIYAGALEALPGVV